jgi:AcrR family transcriptional regulator
MKSSSERPYTSPLRAAQAEQTTARIVEAAVELLAESGPADLSMATVAERAGVSVRTVYRSFATKDELFDGVISWINQRLASQATLRFDTRDDYVLGTRQVVRAVFDIETLYRALFAIPAGREAHRRLSSAERREHLARAYAAEMDGLDERQAHRLAALLHVVSSSNSALFLKDYWDLSPDEIGGAMAWALDVLADAAADPNRREGL